MVTVEHVQLKEVLSYPHAICYIVEDQPSTLVIKATSEYIPKTQFQELFIAVGHVVVKNHITKLIFDKRSLTVFHQPSMEWYFLVWKELMFYHGLKVHRKILPNDQFFRESVRIGRERIFKRHPEGKFNEMDIQYSTSLTDAIEN
jgi:hypothetical protein